MESGKFMLEPKQVSLGRDRKGKATLPRKECLESRRQPSWVLGWGRGELTITCTFPAFHLAQPNFVN